METVTMAQTLAELNEHYGMAGVLAFREEHGLIFADITTPVAKASLCLQGAHLLDWQPVGQEKVLFLSAKSEMAPGRPIRGGIPVLFPWFGPRSDGKEGPMHGFARIQPWTLGFAALAGDDLHLTFTLGGNDLSRGLGFDHFRVAYQVTIGKALKLQLTVANDGTEPLVFEEGLHTYFHVKDVRAITLAGLDGTHYKDKVDGFKVKPQIDGPMHFTGPTDRVYMNTTATCTITDPGFKRAITIEKAGSETTVVWNPWKEMPDIQTDGWHEFACCETVNAGDQTVTLGAGKAKAMEAHISLTAI